MDLLMGFFRFMNLAIQNVTARNNERQMAIALLDIRKPDVSNTGKEFELKVGSILCDAQVEATFQRRIGTSDEKVIQISSAILRENVTVNTQTFKAGPFEVVGSSELDATFSFLQGLSLKHIVFEMKSGNTSSVFPNLIPKSLPLFNDTKNDFLYGTKGRKEGYHRDSIDFLVYIFGKKSTIAEMVSHWHLVVKDFVGLAVKQSFIGPTFSSKIIGENIVFDNTEELRTAFLSFIAVITEYVFSGRVKFWCFVTADGIESLVDATDDVVSSLGLFLGSLETCTFSQSAEDSMRSFCNEVADNAILNRGNVPVLVTNKDGIQSKNFEVVAINKDLSNGFLNTLFQHSLDPLIDPIVLARGYFTERKLSKADRDKAEKVRAKKAKRGEEKIDEPIIEICPDFLRSIPSLVSSKGFVLPDWLVSFIATARGKTAGGGGGGGVVEVAPVTDTSVGGGVVEVAPVTDTSVGGGVVEVAPVTDTSVEVAPVTDTSVPISLPSGSVLAIDKVYLVTLSGNGQSVVRLNGETHQLTTALVAKDGSLPNPFVIGLVDGKPAFKVKNEKGKMVDAPKVILPYPKTGEEIQMRIGGGMVTFLSGVTNTEMPHPFVGPLTFTFETKDDSPVVLTEIV